MILPPLDFGRVRDDEGSTSCIWIRMLSPRSPTRAEYARISTPDVVIGPVEWWGEDQRRNGVPVPPMVTACHLTNGF